MTAYRRILPAVDGSEAAEAGLREALRLAKSEAAEPLVVDVVKVSRAASCGRWSARGWARARFSLLTEESAT